VEHRALAHVGHLRGAQVHLALRGGIDEVGRLLDRRGGGSGFGHEGPASDLRVEHAVVHEVLVGARHSSRRDPEPPGQVAHRRQAMARRDRPSAMAARIDCLSARCFGPSAPSSEDRRGGIE
jgi:hypothetical protein